MTRVWRICKQRHAPTAFDGEGARLGGGRWNSPGTRVVYTVDSAALAALEVLVHVEDASLLGTYTLIPAEADAALIETMDDALLPADLRASPPPRSTRRIGDDWVADGTSVGLRVPSVIVPGDIVLLNPLHPSFDEVAIRPPVDWRFDPRLSTRVEE